MSLSTTSPLVGSIALLLVTVSVTACRDERPKTTPAEAGPTAAAPPGSALEGGVARWIPPEASPGFEADADKYYIAFNQRPYGHVWQFDSRGGGDPRPQIGDVLPFSDAPLVVRAEGPYRFITTFGEDGDRIYLEQPDGSKQLVHLRLGRLHATEAEGARLANLAKTLPPAVIHGLWGISIPFTAWTKETSALLQRLDIQHTCLAVDEWLDREEWDRYERSEEPPPLPKELRYLVIEPYQGDFTDLAHLTRLRYLRVGTSRWSSPASLAALRGLRQLQYLYLEGNTDKDEVLGFQALGHLTQLRVLDLWGQEVRNLDFVRSLRALRRLDLRYTKADDLSAIGGLKQLEVVRADMAPIERLPTGPLPALRRLTLLSTKVSEQDVAAFARAHPRCTVHRRWVEMLRHEVSGTTRLRMYQDHSERYHDFFPRTLMLDIDAAEQIAKFVDLIDIDESVSTPRCGEVVGAATFKFYRGSERVATLTIHKGECLGWNDRWPHVAKLTEQSAAALRTFFAQRGIVERPIGGPYVRLR